MRPQGTYRGCLSQGFVGPENSKNETGAALFAELAKCLPVTRGLKFSPQNPPEDVPVSPELRRKSWLDTLLTLTSLSQFQNNETLNLKGIKGHFKDEI